MYSIISSLVACNCYLHLSLIWNKQVLEWSETYVSNVAGVIAIAIATVIWVTSLPRFRRKMFELFFYTHHLYILYIIFYVLHVGPAYFCMILPGIFLFAVDRYLRFLQSRNRARLLSARALPCGVVELNFSKSPGNQQRACSKVLCLQLKFFKCLPT